MSSIEEIHQNQNEIRSDEDDSDSDSLEITQEDQHVPLVNHQEEPIPSNNQIPMLNNSWTQNERVSFLNKIGM